MVGKTTISHITVDGRTPAAVDTVNIPLFTRFHTCQVVSRISSISRMIQWQPGNQFIHDQLPGRYDMIISVVSCGAVGPLEDLIP